MGDEDRNGTEQRPSPEALLAEVGHEGRGRLKIFLGAAPGVGKTYEMLTSARRRKLDGVDVVVGLVETHGRRETAALLAGLEILPRRRLEYRGREIEEMDLDRLLAAQAAAGPGRRAGPRQCAGQPASQAVDGRRGAADGRHRRVEHHERPARREPQRRGGADHACPRARDGARQRARPSRDRTHRPHTGRAARTAARGQGLCARGCRPCPRPLLQPRQSHCPARAGAAADGRARRRPDGPVHARRTALRARGRPASDCSPASMAARVRPGWFAIPSDWPTGCAHHGRQFTSSQPPVATPARPPTTGWPTPCALAERLGGETLVLPGERIADEILAWARANNVTQILIGSVRRSGWRDWLKGSLPRNLIRGADDIVVLVLPEGGETAPPKRVRARTSENRRPLPALLAVAMVAVATAAGWLLQNVLDLSNVALVFVLPVLTSALAWGLGPALAAACASVLAYNFFFIDPLYTFSINEPENVAGIVLFSIVAVLASGIAARTRAQTLMARQEATRAGALYAFAKKLTGVAAIDDLLVGRRPPGGDHAQGRGRLPSARGRPAHRAGGLSARGPTRRQRPRRCGMVLAQRCTRGPRLRQSARAHHACSCRCGPHAASSAWWASGRIWRAHC